MEMPNQIMPTPLAFFCGIVGATAVGHFGAYVSNHLRQLFVGDCHHDYTSVAILGSAIFSAHISEKNPQYELAAKVGAIFSTIFLVSKGYYNEHNQNKSLNKSAMVFGVCVSTFTWMISETFFAIIAGGTSAYYITRNA